MRLTELIGKSEIVLVGQVWYFLDTVWSTDEFENITEDIHNAMVDCQARVVGSS